MYMDLAVQPQPGGAVGHSVGILELCSCDCGERCPMTLFTKSSVAMVAILLEAK